MKILSIFKFEGAKTWHPSGTLTDFGGCSWLLKWWSGTPSGFIVMSLSISFIWKRIGDDSFIQIQDIKMLSMVHYLKAIVYKTNLTLELCQAHLKKKTSIENRKSQNQEKFWSWVKVWDSCNTPIDSDYKAIPGLVELELGLVFWQFKGIFIYTRKSLWITYYF